MHRIATTAVSFALLGSIAGSHLATLTSAQPAKADATTVKTASAVQPAAPAPVMVTVQPGDTLSGIADTHNSTYVRIFDANDSVTDPNVINPGQQLRIPDPNEQLPDRTLPAAAAPVAAAATAAPTAVRSHSAASGASYALPDDAAKAFIYSHESGNNPNATSPNGCYGLGQDCNGRVRAQCGADYACQDAYFTNYAKSRYGSWSAAAAAWQSKGWW